MVLFYIYNNIIENELSEETHRRTWGVWDFSKC